MIKRVRLSRHSNPKLVCTEQRSCKICKANIELGGEIDKSMIILETSLPLFQQYIEVPRKSAMIHNNSMVLSINRVQHTQYSNSRIGIRFKLSWTVYQDRPFITIGP